jgi:hypothetical protein
MTDRVILGDLLTLTATKGHSRQMSGQPIALPRPASGTFRRDEAFVPEPFALPAHRTDLAHDPETLTSAMKRPFRNRCLEGKSICSPRFSRTNKDAPDTSKPKVLFLL